jgi:hypothetical protein
LAALPRWHAKSIQRLGEGDFAGERTGDADGSARPDGSMTMNCRLSIYPSFARPKIEKVRQPAPRAWLVRDAVR